jgi:hypothetical protein
MKDKDKRFGVPKIDRLFVPVPHELVLDYRVSSSAQRLWEGLHLRLAQVPARSRSPG